MRNEVLAARLLINALVLFLVFNTWFTDWTAHPLRAFGAGDLFVGPS